MENVYPDNAMYSIEKDTAIEQKQPKSPVKDKPILLQLFKEVFLGFFADIGKGIYQFFKRYTVLIWDCIKFLWRPNADAHSKANEATIHNAKETFEFILIITALNIFLVKENIIASTIKESYGDDIIQYIIEILLFFTYSFIYFIVLVILILTGRLLRTIFKPIETRDVTDKVFINLNNIFFLFTIIYAFILKFDSDFVTSRNIGESSIILYSIPMAAIVFLFFIRLVMINKVTVGKAIAYCLIAPALISVILALCGLMIIGGFSGL